MRIQELIEFSLLDSLGLLEPDESALLAKAKAEASPAVQDHVRREQARLAESMDWLPEVDPPASLREAVLARVRAAMAAEREARSVVHGAADSTHGSRIDAPRKRKDLVAIVPSKQVSRLWRAAALGLLTAAVVLSTVFLELRGRINELDRRIRENSFTDESIRALGPGVKDLLLSGDFQRVRFSPSDAAYEGQATLWFDPESRTAYLICDRLPELEGRSYTLVVLNDEGAITERLARFSSDGRFMQREVTLVIQPQSRLAIVASGVGGEISPVLLTSELGSRL